MFGLIALMLVISTTSCAPKPADEPAGEEPAAEEPAAEEPAAEAPAAEKTSITLTMPDDIIAFNGINTGGGYQQALGELVMLSLAETDPMGNIFPELAAEIPTIENGGVVFDEETWSMTVTWKLREDVYWADGEQVTADDVIFTWNVIAEEAWTAAVDYTESVEKIDDFTFVVNYYEGYVFPDYELQFGGEDFFIYPEHYCDAEQWPIYPRRVDRR